MGIDTPAACCQYVFNGWLLTVNCRGAEAERPSPAIDPIPSEAQSPLDRRRSS